MKSIRRLETIVGGGKNMATTQITAYKEILEFLVSTSCAEEILSFYPSLGTVERVRDLVDGNSEGRLNYKERAELQAVVDLIPYMHAYRIWATNRLSAH
jgi:hypothetical protein